MAKAAQAAKAAGLGSLLPPSIRKAAFPTPASLDNKMAFSQTDAKDAKEVSLFEGCFGTALESSTQVATRRLLDLCGYKVNVPREQGCCGAIAAHDGNLEGARRCHKTNLTAFKDEEVIVTTASGCAVQIESLEGLGGKHIEAGETIANNHKGKLGIKDANGLSIIIHVPCTQRRLSGKGALGEKTHVSGSRRKDILCGRGNPLLWRRRTHLDGACANWQ